MFNLEGDLARAFCTPALNAKIDNNSRTSNLSVLHKLPEYKYGQPVHTQTLPTIKKHNYGQTLTIAYNTFILHGMM